MFFNDLHRCTLALGLAFLHSITVARDKRESGNFERFQGEIVLKPQTRSR